ncbi:MAG: 1-acyl-sn-glycerol-3-phosphate acyltransferase [Deltaproteobacteria bacterium]|nr:1-acyl-sn-glycerol-3-phosphate acyltransferase [Deltaproteobacteria bacterium]
MRRVVFGLYTYFEFFALALAFAVIMTIVAWIEPGGAAPRRRGRWMRRFGRLTSRLTPLWRFSVDGAGPEDISTRGYVVVSNHESSSDPFLLSFLPWDMRWIAKEEMFRWPVIGRLMSASGDIPLRRGDRESVKRMFASCDETLRAGLSVMLFPEGTRSPDGNLLPFKPGAFEMAIAAGAPILPLAIDGTRECRPKGSLWFGDARAVVRVLAPIPTQGMTMNDVQKLADLTRDRIALGVRSLRGEAPAPASAELAPSELPAIPARARNAELR